jgi:hypothetical protein
MSIAKLVVPAVLALSLVACASPQVAPEDRVIAVCGEATVSTGSTIAKRDKCFDKTPEAIAANRERAEAMREEQNRIRHDTLLNSK